MVSRDQSGVRSPESGVQPAHGHGTGAFSLIELLVVISVILILSGLMVAVYPALMRGAKRGKTATILATALAALERPAADQAMAVAPVEHPLAGSAEPRPRFLRRQSAGDTVGLALATTGEALRAPLPSLVPGAETRLLLDDDVFADPALPLLVGVERSRCRVIGAGCSLVSRHRRMPDPGPGGALVPPYAAATYPDARFLVEPPLIGWEADGFKKVVVDPATTAWEQAWDATVATALARGQEELVSLGAIARCDPTTQPLLPGNRVRQDVSAGTAGSWAPGLLLEGGVWKRYRLRGAALVDAWGVEVLCSVTGGGSLRLESAGPDGAFAWLPGDDGQLQTGGLADQPAGDDRPARGDNLVVGGR